MWCIKSFVIIDFLLYLSWYNRTFEILNFWNKIIQRDRLKDPFCIRFDYFISILTPWWTLNQSYPIMINTPLENHNITGKLINETDELEKQEFQVLSSFLVNTKHLLWLNNCYLRLYNAYQLKNNFISCLPQVHTILYEVIQKSSVVEINRNVNGVILHKVYLTVHRSKVSFLSYLQQIF